MCIPILGLDFLWKFLQPILSDAVKERLKAKDSATIAKERTYELYEVLGEVKSKTDEFIDELGAYVDEVQTSLPADPDRLSSLRKVSRELMGRLHSLASALDRVNPQLEIHRNEIVREVLAYRGSRALVLSELEQSVGAAHGADASTLRQLLERARANKVHIDEAIDEMRSFLRAEVPFKESF